MMLNDIIPIFPLTIIVMPGEIVPLHIYEPRYKQLINDIIANKESFVIPYVKNKTLTNKGSMVRLYKVLAVSSGGEMDILVQGQEIVGVTSVIEELENRLYSGGKIETIANLNKDASLKLQALYFQYKDEIRRINKNASPDFINPKRILDIAGQLPLTGEEKDFLISQQNDQVSETFLIEKINTFHIINERVEEIGYKFYLN